MSIQIIPYNPLPLILTMKLPIRLKLVCIYAVMISYCYVADLFPYNGVTLKLSGCKPIVIVDINADKTVWVHEFVHVYGGNEFSSEVIDAVTGGSEPTDAELSYAEKTLVRDVRKAIQE